MQRTCLALIAALLIAPTICLGQTLSEFIQEDEPQPWDVSVESTYLRPSINGDVRGELDYSFYEAPRLKFRNSINDIPIEISFWHMQTQDVLYQPYNYTIYVPEFNSFTFQNQATEDEEFEVSTLDIETSNKFEQNGNLFKFSYGLRATHFSDELSINSRGSILGALQSNFINDLYGIGLTTSFSGNIPIHSKSDAFLSYRIRVSALISTNEVENQQLSFQLIPGALNRAAYVLTNTTTDNKIDSLLFSEAQVGIEWNRKFKFLPSPAQFKAMLEYQHWGSNAGMLDEIRYDVPLAVNTRELLELVGLSLTAEVTY